MFDRFSKIFFGAVSAVTHFCMLCLILSIPGFLIYQGEKDPQFTVYSYVCEPAESDGYLAAEGVDADDWYRITYDCGATSGRFSPYTYTVGNFVLRYPADLKEGADYLLDSGGALVFSGGENTDFTLTLFVKADARSAENIARGAAFGTRHISKGFSMIKKEIRFNMPGFGVEECYSES